MNPKEMSQKKMMMNDKRLTRSFTTEFEKREETTEEGIIEGYASVYNQKIEIGNWFYEVIERGAFDEADLTDVLFFTNHNDSKITLARSRLNNPNSTLQLVPDEKGLKFKASIDIKDNSEAKTLYSSVKRGDLDGMSFGFTVEDEEWSDLDSDIPTRSIKKVSKVFEISAVNMPAYDGTSIYARSADSLESDRLALESAKDKLQRAKDFAVLKEKMKIGGKK